MVAKIIIGKSLRGALKYNENKVEVGTAELILASGFAGDIERMNFNQKLQRFENLLMLNPGVKTNTLHISLNFDASEKLTDEIMQKIALTYMEKIGFGDQPFIAYRHHDAAHDHIHLVTTNIRPDGKRIDLHNIGANQSEKARKEIEEEFKLVKAESKQYKTEPEIKAIDIEKALYGHIPTKRAISNTVNAVTRSYKFTSLAELNAVLRQFNVIADRGTEDMQMFRKKGLIYSLLDKNGNKIGVPIKSSSLYIKPTLPWLEKQFLKHEESRIKFKPELKRRLDQVISERPANQEAFLKAIKQRNIAAVFRTGVNGQVYGLTYIDHKNKVVFNGSDLGKLYSAKAMLQTINVNSKASPALQKQAEIHQKSTGTSKKSMASTQMSTRTIANKKSATEHRLTTHYKNTLLSTLLKEPFDPGARLPKKKKKKKLSI